VALIAKTSEEVISGRSYKDAGVDVDAGDRLVEAIKPLAAGTDRAGTLGGLGGFGALFDLRAAGFDDPILVAATDGVGTKLKVAAAVGDHGTIGIDLVAMCVNDLVVQGAEPLFFLDYFATGRLEPDVAAQIVAGIARGCKQAGCALIGGETAEMPGVYRDGDYDLAGFAVGAVERGRVLTGEAVAAGDIVIGLPASGLHSNGFSLVRRIVDEAGLDLAAPAPFDQGTSLGHALLTPTRIYVAACLAGLRTGEVTALAHITGGGLVDNIPRVLPPGLTVRLDAGAWRPPPVFEWLAAAGPVAGAEMLRTFNCGLGMIVIARPAGRDRVLDALHTAGEDAAVVGAVEDRPAGSPAVIVDGGDAPWLG